MGARTALALCTFALIGIAQAAAAAENAPGSSCSTANLWQWAGGPENNGVINGMFCNGTAWSGVINFKSSGNIGIGTTSPARPLHVYGTANDQLILEGDEAGESGLELLSKGPNGGKALGDVTTQGWQLFVRGDSMGSMQNYLGLSYWDGTTWADVVNVDGGGKMSVGENPSAPMATLDVNGGIKVGNNTGTCTGTNNGELRYSGTAWSYCNGSAWTPFSSAGCGVYSYSFPAIAPQPASTLASSTIVPISTNACSAAVTISGVGSPQFRICADSSCSTVVDTWGSTSQTIANGQFVQARLTTSASNNTDIATLAVGGTLGNFSVDTVVTYKTVFITSTLYGGGGLGGVWGADAKCASAATAAGRAGTYFAWIADSTDASAPAARFTQASISYRTVNLAKVADNWAGLTSGTLASTINMDENGNPSSIPDNNWSGQKPFYSNVNANGTRVGTSNCTNWTSTSGSGKVGDAKQTGATWSNATSDGCDNTFSKIHLLCVQQ